MNYENSNSRRPRSTNWRRPPGPINVWRVIDAYEIQNGIKKPVKISIQEIPEDKFTEVLDHYRQNYLEDEPYCKLVDMKRKHPDAVEDFCTLWTYALEQGMTVGAFKLDSEGKITDVIGANMLIVATSEVDAELKEIIAKFKSPLATNIYTMTHDYSDMPDLRSRFNTDKYILATGLSVSKSYRGQMIGYHLLKARDDIGRKYGIIATSTIFSSPKAQSQAERAGFEVFYKQSFEDFLKNDEYTQGRKIDSDYLSIMIKRLP